MANIFTFKALIWRLWSSSFSSCIVSIIPYPFRSTVFPCGLYCDHSIVQFFIIHIVIASLAALWSLIPFIYILVYSIKRLNFKIFIAYNICISCLNICVDDSSVFLEFPPNIRFLYILWEAANINLWVLIFLWHLQWTF